MKNTFTALLLLLGVTCFAQVTPQYYIDYHPNYPNPPYAAGMALLNDTGVLQNLYLRDSFTTAPPPYGRVQNIYLRTGAGAIADSILWKGCKATKVVISLGYTSLTNFNTVTSLLTNLTVVATIDTLITDTVRTAWIRIPVNSENAFYIDTTQNLVMQFAIDTGGYRRLPGNIPNGASGCLYWASFYSQFVQDFYSIAGGKSNAPQVGRNYAFHDFGIDLQPLGVNELQNVSDLRIYPNPSAGRLIISMAAKRMVQDARLTITDMTGRILWQQPYKNIDADFYQQLDMSAYPKGIYIAELRADGERITRKLVLQ